MGYKHNDSCLAKVADDEPIFVLRAQDVTAPEVVRYWADRVSDDYYNAHPGQSMPVSLLDKLDEADRCAEAMEAWPNRKLPD